MNEEKKDFVVRDRRAFSSQDEMEPAEKTGGDSSDAQGPQPEITEAEAKRSAERLEAMMDEVESAGVGPEGMYFPKIDFATFIFSLNSSTLVHLGIIEEPSTGKSSKNLILAKQTIDILGMLEEKTRGNLTPDEERMLKNILYDLRILYVKEKR